MRSIVATYKRLALAKVVTWRLLVLLVLTPLCVYIVTGSWEVGLQVSIVELVVKTVAQYIFELAWSSVEKRVLREEISGGSGGANS